MARNFRLWENAIVIDLLAAAADAAGRTSAYYSLANGHKAFLLCSVNQGNAAQVTWTPLQATDNVGAGSKGLTSAAPLAVNAATAAGDQLTFPTAATSYQQAATTSVNNMVMFEIDPIESMDINNKFNHIAVSTSASNAGNITSAKLIIMPLRFAQQNPPTATV